MKDQAHEGEHKKSGAGNLNLNRITANEICISPLIIRANDKYPK